MDTRSPPVGLHSPEAAVPFKMEKPPRSRRLDVGRDDPGRLFGQPPPALVDRSRVHGANTRTADRGPSSLKATYEGRGRPAHSSKPSTPHHRAARSEITVPCATTISACSPGHIVIAASTACSKRAPAWFAV